MLERPALVHVLYVYVYGELLQFRVAVTEFAITLTAEE